MGVKKIGSQKSYHLQIKLPYEVTMDYYIKCQTFLPYKTIANVKMKGKWMQWKREYFDYKMVDGILYPHSFKYAFVDRKWEKGKIVKVEINPQFPPNYFKVPQKK